METKKNVRILIFDNGSRDKNELCDKGYCKLYLNKITQTLTIKFDHKGQIESIKALLDWNFIVRKNALFAADLSISPKFVLIFKNSILAQKIYKILTKNKEISEDVDFQSKFVTFLGENNLPPKIKKMLSSILENNKKITSKFFNQIQERKRRHSSSFSNNGNADRCILKSTNTTTLSKHGPKKFCKQKRKVIYKPAYEIVEKRFCGSSSQKLSVFASAYAKNRTDESQLCYDYFLWKGIYCCEECIKGRLRKTAYIRNFGKKNEYLELYNGKHVCTPKSYDPKRFQAQKRIIKKPFYEILEKNDDIVGDEDKLYLFLAVEKPRLCYEYIRCNKSDFRCEGCRKQRIKRYAQFHKIGSSNDEFVEVLNDDHACQPFEFVEKDDNNKIIKKPAYELFGKTNRGVRHLVIFDPANKDLCYEYKEERFPIFLCLGCTRWKKARTIKILNFGEENECLQINNVQHVCDLRPYDPQKFAYKEEKTIQKPGFIFEGKRKLFIFDENNQEFGYQYTLDNTRYLCVQCRKMDKKVYAKAKDENVESIKIGSDLHICQPQRYLPEKEVIFDSTKFEMVSANRGAQNILLFIDAEKRQCYRFRYHHGYWACCECAKMHQYLLLKLNERENGENYVTMKVDAKHICEPEEYHEPQEQAEMVTVTNENFIFYETNEKCKNNKIRLIQFLDDDKKLCYDFRSTLNKCPTQFKCSKCSTLQKTVPAKVCKNYDGSEYLQMNKTKHFCKPIKYTTLKSNIKHILEKNSSGFAPDQYKFEVKTDEKSGVKTLIVFHSSEDLSHCYKLRYIPNAKCFQCFNCKNQKKLQVTAKFEYDNNGEKVVVYGKKQHACEPVKYHDDDEDDGSQKFKNFIHFYKNDKYKVPKLIVFTDESKTYCYEYSTYKSVEYYFCLGCNPQKNLVAKVKTDKIGEEYLEFCGKEHDCIPQIFDQSKYEYTVIPPIKYELFPNCNGKPNSTIIVFGDSDFEYGYDFRHDSLNNFICKRCTQLNHRVSVKLYGDNADDEIYLEQSSKQHECSAKNYLLHRRLVYPQNYKLENIDGKQIITTSHPNDKKVLVRFAYDNELNVFYCITCKEKNRYLAAKICKRNNTEFLLLAFDHICFSLCK